MSDNLPDYSNEEADEKTQTKRFLVGWVKEGYSTSRSYDIELENDVQLDLAILYMNHLSVLIEKNQRYGNSALEPLGCFSKDSAVDGVLVRIDDKLQRIKNSDEIRKNDVSDLVGYLMLYMVKRGWVNHGDLVD